MSRLVAAGAVDLLEKQLGQKGSRRKGSRAASSKQAGGTSIQASEREWREDTANANLAVLLGTTIPKSQRRIGKKLMARNLKLKRVDKAEEVEEENWSLFAEEDKAMAEKQRRLEEE